MTIIAIFGLATITSAQVPSYVPTTGLVGYWPFNGNANDESGNGNNGTVNGAVLTSDRFSNANNAYFFNGINNWIETDTSFLQTNNPHSISIWWQTSDSTKYEQTLFNTYPHTLEVFQFNYPLLNYTLSFGLGNGLDVLGSWDVFFPANISSPPTLGQWHQSVWVKDASLNWNIYQDGVLIHTFNSATNTGSQIASLRFGAYTAFGGGAYFIGNLDDIGVWNRALDSCEVKDLYFASLGNCCNISVTTQPINQSVNISNNAQFTTASSDPLATYQWQTDLGVGYLNLNGVGQYSGTTNDTLTVANVTLSNNNQPFRCIISLGACADTSNVAILTVNNNVGINEFTQDNLFSVYPNPAKSQINVKADAKLLGSIYTVYDNTGKLVLTGKINSENTVIELGNLSGGIYLFSVGENLKQTFKVIKE